MPARVRTLDDYDGGADSLGAEKLVFEPFEERLEPFEDTGFSCREEGFKAISAVHDA